jgi:GAF domain-containing protein
VHSSSTAVAAALTDAARTINAPRSLDETLDSIIEAARSALPSFGHVGISELLPDGRIETRAGTDPWVWELDAIQYSLDEGPCVDAIRHDPVVTVPHAVHEQRWPHYIRSAVPRGLRSQLAVPLVAWDTRLGGLNMYSTDAEGIDDTAVDMAQMFGVHAGIALGRARREDQLSEAMFTRQTIGQAIGIIMVRYDIDSEHAFQFLVRASTTSNIKLRDIAREVVEEHNTRSGRG